MPHHKPDLPLSPLVGEGMPQTLQLNVHLPTCGMLEEEPTFIDDKRKTGLEKPSVENVETGTSSLKIDCQSEETKQSSIAKLKVVRRKRVLKPRAVLSLPTSKVVRLHLFGREMSQIEKVPKLHLSHNSQTQLTENADPNAPTSSTSKRTLQLYSEQEDNIEAQLQLLQHGHATNSTDRFQPQNAPVNNASDWTEHINPLDKNARVGEVEYSDAAQTQHFEEALHHNRRYVETLGKRRPDQPAHIETQTGTSSDSQAAPLGIDPSSFPHDVNKHPLNQRIGIKQHFPVKRDSSRIPSLGLDVTLPSQKPERGRYPVRLLRVRRATGSAVKLMTSGKLTYAVPVVFPPQEAFTTPRKGSLERESPMHKRSDTNKPRALSKALSGSLNSMTGVNVGGYESDTGSRVSGTGKSDINMPPDFGQLTSRDYVPFTGMRFKLPSLPGQSDDTETDFSSPKFRLQKPVGLNPELDQHGKDLHVGSNKRALAKIRLPPVEQSKKETSTSQLQNFPSEKYSENKKLGICELFAREG